jgi:putative glycerol-1-phosphate prenyltransferase
MSNTTPIPYDKPEIAAATAIAGELLGLKLMYMDGGSGAQKPISAAMIGAVRKYVDAPIIIGGGIRTGAEAQEVFGAGADVIVVGTAIEQSPELLIEICACTQMMNK